MSGSPVGEVGRPSPPRQLTPPEPLTPAEPFSPTEPCIRTAHLAGTGGKIGPDPEDFEVEEIPAYPLSGTGSHEFLLVEKRGENTRDVARILARIAGISERDVGFAGMKDRHAVTRQWFSVPHDAKVGERVWELGPTARVVERTRHENKLRTGHLIGNRFRITLVDVPEARIPDAELIAEALRGEGLVNFFGPQRFGREGRNLAEALGWLQREVRRAGAHAERENDSGGGSGRRERSKGRHSGKRGPDEKLLSSVIQAELFNRYASRRLALAEPLIVGEAVRLRGTGSHFVVEALERELPRQAAGDLLLTGAMIGPRTLQSAGRALEFEHLAQAELGLGAAELTALARHAPGSRRDLLLVPEELDFAPLPGNRLELRFRLPAGAYATQVVREFTRTPWAEARGDFRGG